VPDDRQDVQGRIRPGGELSQPGRNLAVPVPARSAGQDPTGSLPGRLDRADARRGSIVVFNEQGSPTTTPPMAARLTAKRGSGGTLILYHMDGTEGNQIKAK